MIKPIQTVAFNHVDQIKAVSFAQRRVAVQLGNTSGLGNQNDWCEIRTEPSNMALMYHVFETSEQAEQYCRDFGTVTKLDADGMRRFNYLLGKVA